MGRPYGKAAAGWGPSGRPDGSGEGATGGADVAGASHARNAGQELEGHTPRVALGAPNGDGTGPSAACGPPNAALLADATQWEGSPHEVAPGYAGGTPVQQRVGSYGRVVGVVDPKGSGGSRDSDEFPALPQSTAVVA